MNLESLNKAGTQNARLFFYQCCSCDTWVDRMCAGRPYATRQVIFEAADANWQDLGEADYLQAFKGHPKIGDLESLTEHYPDTKTRAANEQGSILYASDQALKTLATANQQYEDRYGFIFIVCATGKSAAEMVALLDARLSNNRATEIQIAAEEQRKITHIRLEKLL